MSIEENEIEWLRRPSEVAEPATTNVATSILLPSSKFHLYSNLLREKIVKQKYKRPEVKIHHDTDRIQSLLQRADQIKTDIVQRHRSYYQKSIQQRKTLLAQAPALTKPSFKFKRPAITVQALSKPTERAAALKVLRRYYDRWALHAFFHLLLLNANYRAQSLNNQKQLQVLHQPRALVPIHLTLPLHFVLRLRILRRRRHAQLLLGFLQSCQALNKPLQYYYREYKSRVVKCLAHLKDWLVVSRYRRDAVAKLCEKRFRVLLNRFEDNERMKAASAERERKQRMLNSKAMIGLSKWEQSQVRREMAFQQRENEQRRSINVREQYKDLLKQQVARRLIVLEAHVRTKRRMYLDNLPRPVENAKTELRDMQLARELIRSKDAAALEGILEEQLNRRNKKTPAEKFFYFYTDAKLGRTWAAIADELARADVAAVVKKVKADRMQL